MSSFSFERWRLLAGRHWAENKKRYLLSFFAFIGLLVFWFVFVLLINQTYYIGYSVQQATYFVCLFVIGSFYASQFFSDLSSQPKGLNFLLTPASTLEKLACGLFYVVPVFFVFFTLAFYIVDVAMVTLANVLQTSVQSAGTIPEKSEVINLFVAPKHNANSVNISFYLLLLFFAVQSFFLLGSVYFTKFSFVKTAISIFLLFFAAYFIEAYVMHAFLPKGGHGSAFTQFYIVKEDSTRDKSVALPGWINDVLTTLLRYAFAPLFWIITYYRLKEKEV